MGPGLSLDPTHLTAKPSFASIQTHDESSTSGPASGVVSQKPSYASLASTHGLVAAAAPIAGAANPAPPRPSALTDVPESPRTPVSLKKWGVVFRGPASPVAAAAGFGPTATPGLGAGLAASTTAPAAAVAAAAATAAAKPAAAPKAKLMKEKAEAKKEKPKKPPTKFDEYKKRFFTFGVRICIVERLYFKPLALPFPY